MSMISGQIDRLRTAAQTYRRLGNHTAEGMFLEAADTICELQAENAKLRESVKRLMTQRDERLARAETDNAKLRELVRLLLWGIDNDMPRYEELAWTQKVNALVHKLRVEVDE